MTSAAETLNQWLRDAHAAEEQAETMLSSMARRVEDYPEVKAGVERHLAETQRQAEQVRSCIERRGASTSAIKDTTGKIVALGQSLAGVFASDEIVKAALAAYAFEHMEVASYTILIAAAEAEGDVETASVCRVILEEEQAMADWLRQQLPSVTEAYLRRSE